MSYFKWHFYVFDIFAERKKIAEIAANYQFYRKKHRAHKLNPRFDMQGNWYWPTIDEILEKCLAEREVIYIKTQVPSLSALASEIYMYFSMKMDPALKNLKLRPPHAPES